MACRRSETSLPRCRLGSLIAVAFAAAALVVEPGIAQPLDQVNTAVVAASTGSWFERVSDIAAIIALIGVIITAIAARWNAKRERRAKANDAQAVILQQKLERFYDPYLLRSNANKLLALDLKDRNANLDRLLMALTDPSQKQALSPADKAIIAEIVGNGQALSELIRSNAGHIDPRISEYLQRAEVHFLALRLAHEGKLDNAGAAFERYVYPRQLDAALEAERSRLQGRLDLLRSEPETEHGALPTLNLEEADLIEWPGIRASADEPTRS